MKEADIKSNLKWLKSQGFGGVELCFIYPLDRMYRNLGPAFLSQSFNNLLIYTKKQCEKLDLHLDFTFGSLWPFGGSWVQEEDSANNFHGPDPRKRIERSWEEPLRVREVNHLSAAALSNYSKVIGAAFAPALQKGRSSGLFCDSWEGDSSKLWSPGLFDEFKLEFGYDLRPFCDELDDEEQKNVAVRFDYRKFLSKVVIREFYTAFTKEANNLCAFTRVQCHGSPTDLLEAYSVVDVPESECLLFPVRFSRIVSSAAALSAKPLVTCETFTCIYGFPANFQGVEQVADLKLLADATFSQGVNHIFWHGTPFQSPKSSERFYATTHVGRDSGFVDELLPFNQYLEKVQSALRGPGGALQYAAMYIPHEDMMMLDWLPREIRNPGAHHYWEMRHVVTADEIHAYHPLFVSYPFLKKATVCDGCMRLPQTPADQRGFRFLYIDSQYMHLESLQEILRLAQDGLPVVLKQAPKCPGKLPRDELFASALSQLQSLSNVYPDVLKVKTVSPLVALSTETSDNSKITSLWYWIRQSSADGFTIFFPHPLAETIKYPMKYGSSFSDKIIKKRILLALPGGSPSHEIELEFRPYQSLLYRVEKALVTPVDITFVPSTPVNEAEGMDRWSAELKRMAEKHKERETKHKSK